MFERIQSIEFWNYTFVGNTIGDFGVAITAFAVSLVVLGVFQVAILNRLQTIAKRTKTDIDDTLISIIRSLKPPFYSFLAFYVATLFLSLGSALKKVIDIALVVWITIQAIIAVQILIDYIVRKRISEEDDTAVENAVNILGKLSKWVLWSFAFLLVLSNIGVDITSLIAGLGIGGIAIALALQNTLGELFSSFAIYFDKPFVPGDFIVVGDRAGTIERIGIKTTRMRALQGEEIVLSNKELTTAQIQNFKKMQQRRIAFSFGVTYETPTEKLKQIPDIVRGVIDDVEHTRFDRAHFKRFDDSSLNFEVVYYVTSNDYNIYMDVQQAINLGIMGAFEKLGVSMAYPTHTVYLQK